MILESVAMADTGADIAVCDLGIINILGREPLQVATINIHGCTGTSNNKKKDKLLIVTSDKEVTVIETRQVPELGYNGPDRDTFKIAVKTELGITTKNEKKFDFNDSNVTPRILIGLKSGELLAEKLKENQLLEQNLDLAFFSPDLTVWKTALNTKYLITGQIGVNPELVELQNNFPRFTFLIGENESDEDIHKRVIEKGRKLLKRNLTKLM